MKAVHGSVLVYAYGVKTEPAFCSFFEVFIWYSGVGWGGVGWGGVITYMVRCCEFSCACITLTYMLRCCKFSCASLHTSCYAAARPLALPYIPTCYVAASSLALPYIPTCYAAASSLALPYILHATLRPCTSIHTVMLRCCKFSCASLHTSCYAATLHFHTYRHATLLQVLLHFPTYFMLRCDLALPYIPSCYAAASSLALPYIRHATLLQVLLHFPAYVHATLLHFLCFPREFMLSHVWGGVVPYSNWFIFLVIYTYIYKSLADVCPKSTEFHSGLPSAVLFPCVFFRTLRACKILILPASHGIFALSAKITFWRYLKDILRNLQCFEPLTETSTNRKTLKEH